MSPKKRPEPEPEEEREPSRAGGVIVLTVLAGAGLGAVYAASPATAVGTVWVVGAGALWKAARHRNKIDNPSPPPPEPPSPNTTPQFTVVEDREGRHCTVRWEKGPTHT